MKSKKIIVTEKSKVEISYEELPELGKTEVLLENLYSAISPGTELAYIKNLENTPGKFPYYPGYSSCCRIKKKGSEVKGLKVGQIVVCNTKHESHTIVDSSKCIPLPENVNPEEACVYRLASIALQGVRKAEIQIGSDIIVFGLGPIGNLTFQLSCVAGSTFIQGVEPIKWRREIAIKCGIDSICGNAGDLPIDRRYNVVFESTGVPDVIPLAFKVADKFGKIIILGSTRGNTDNVNFYTDVHKRCLNIIGANDSCRSKKESVGNICTGKFDDETIVKLLSKRRINIKPLISDIVSPEDAEDAYNILDTKSGNSMIIVFKWI